MVNGCECVGVYKGGKFYDMCVDGQQVWLMGDKGISEVDLDEKRIE